MAAVKVWWIGDYVVEPALAQIGWKICKIGHGDVKRHVIFTRIALRQICIVRL